MEAESTRSSPSLSEPIATSAIYIATRVHGRTETGLTIIDKSGQGTFYPDDETPLPEPAYGDNSKRKVQTAPLANSTPLEALYPQWVEGQAEAGIAVCLVSNAVNDLEKLLEPCTNDIEALNYLVLVETQLFQALPKARFNKAFEIVNSFCAWAVRNIEMQLPEIALLQGMCSALRELSESPFLSVDRSTSLIANLQRLGWRGESPISRSFEEGLSAVFDELQVI